MSAADYILIVRKGYHISNGQKYIRKKFLVSNMIQGITIAHLSKTKSNA